jgi:hypothetical protein
MRIIDKRKDYYDYLMGVYGRDELLTYDRRGGTHIGNSYSWVIGNVVKVAVVGLEFTFFRDKDDGWLWSPEELLRYTQKHGKTPDGYGGWRETTPQTIEEATRLHRLYNDTPTDLNNTLREPVLIKTGRSTWERLSNLSDLKFARVMDSHTIYTEISNFLGWCNDNPPLPDSMTDRDKVLSHGFDLKTSFRKCKQD